MITDQDIDDALPIFGPATPDPLEEQPNQVLLNAIIKTLRDRVGVRKSQTIATDYAVTIDDAGTWLICDNVAPMVITLDEGMTLPVDRVLSINVKRINAEVTFENTSRVPYTDMNGLGTLVGIAQLVYDGNNWTIHGDFAS